jgi:DNA-binding NarL/FixJ family response regulator
MTTLAIVDDNEMLRSNVVKRLKDDFRIIFEAGNAPFLLKFLRTHPPLQHPQIILMDIGMEDMDGIEATAAVKKINDSIQVIMLTVFEDETKVLNAIKAGAAAYIIKDEKKETLISIINDVIGGGSYLSPAVARKAFHYLQEIYTPKQASTDNPLTKREQEVLQLIIKGYKYNQVSETLFISIDTVKSHIRHIYEKLQVSGKMEAARKVTEKRWL